jgi:hypothetical protein
MLIPKDPGAIPARNFCGFVEAAATDNELPDDIKPTVVKAPADFRNNLRSSLNFICQILQRKDAFSAVAGLQLI